MLEDVAREEEEEEEEYEREDDRRIAQRRLISEQLKLGLMQGKKRKFTEKRAGPVIVQTLGGVSSRTATGMLIITIVSMNGNSSNFYIPCVCRWCQGIFTRQIPETPTIFNNAQIIFQTYIID